MSICDISKLLTIPTSVPLTHESTCEQLINALSFKYLNEKQSLNKTLIKKTGIIDGTKQGWMPDVGVP